MSVAYTVTKLSPVAAQVRVLMARAAELGIHQRVADAMQRINDHLVNHPLEWGDPEFRLVHEGGIVCHAIEDPFAVRFAVYETEKVVCLLNIVPLSRSPLAHA